MLTKEWLIRTSSNQIVGPLTQEKVISLLAKGAIHKGDELCKGNGFWFQVLEADLLEKYLKNNELMPFNFIAEANDVLTAGLAPGAPYEFENTVPGSTYLSMQDEDSSAPDITKVGVNLDELKVKDDIKDQKNDLDEKRDLPTPPTSHGDTTSEKIAIEIAEEVEQTIDPDKIVQKDEQSGVKFPCVEDLEFPEVDNEQLLTDRSTPFENNSREDESGEEIEADTIAPVEMTLDLPKKEKIEKVTTQTQDAEVETKINNTIEKNDELKESANIDNKEVRNAPEIKKQEFEAPKEQKQINIKVKQKGKSWGLIFLFILLLSMGLLGGGYFYLKKGFKFSSLKLIKPAYSQNSFDYTQSKKKDFFSQNL